MPRLAPLVDIARYQSDAEAALRLYYSSSHTEYAARFATYLLREVQEEFEQRLQETEMRSSLIVLARLEAAFRTDYRQRARLKLNDPISVDFRKLFKARRERARLEDDILEVWRRHLDPSSGQYISHLRRMLKYRHWLAHGRHWAFADQREFQDVYLLADTIFTNFNLLT